MNAERPVIEIPIDVEPNIVVARGAARSAARDMGFGITDQTRFATAISELTRNVIRYGGKGECLIEDASDASVSRLKAVVMDDGPGIADIDQAMEDGFSTGRSLGAGLPATRRLVHEFEIRSKPGETVISIAIVREK